jgi:hypothetical protein
MGKLEYQSPKGTCVYCKNDFTKQDMKSHLPACTARQDALAEEPEKETIYHIRTQGAYSPDYWLYFEMSGQQQLADLDTFLRKIWLECCGHMSAFEIDGKRYSVRPMAEYGERNMKSKLKDVLSDATDFTHEYDFGDTTLLMLQVVETRQGNLKENWRLLARNHPPEIPCQSCKKRIATHICTECMWDEEADAVLCKTCLKSHECDETMLLPLVNSPRVGQCGFTGAPLT